MKNYVRTVGIFVFTFYIEKNRNGERVLADISGQCPLKGCGGKLPAVVAVGRIEEDHYSAKNVAALWKDSEFELPAQLFCTNCDGRLEVPQEASVALSNGAARFLRSLREERRSLKADSN